MNYARSSLWLLTFHACLLIPTAPLRCVAQSATGLGDSSLEQLANVNIITKQGRDVDGLELSIEAGPFSSYKGRASYGGMLRGVDFLVSGTFYGTRGQDRLFFPRFDTPGNNDGIATNADDDQVGSGLATVNFLDRKYFDPPSNENLQMPIQQDGRSFRVLMNWRWVLR